MDDREEESSSSNENRSRRAGPSRDSSADEPRSHASRLRRLMSHATVQEDDLDNSVLNSQQQFIDIDASSDSETDEEYEVILEQARDSMEAEGEANIETSDDRGDALFEQYVQESAETTRSQTRIFDNELPLSHSYLGDNMDRVIGTNVYEPGKVYELPVCRHHSLVFPGEIIPMIMQADSIFASTPETSEGLAFGLIVEDAPGNTTGYGVACQVFEKGVNEYGHITIKSKAHQRFMVVKTDDDRLTTVRNQKHYAKVRILPEYNLPDPINLSLSNNLKRFTQNSTQTEKIKNILTYSSQWPKFVYNHYSVGSITEKIERFLAMLSLEAPADPIEKSFWLARNVPLNQIDRIRIFASNCVNQRMMLIGETLNFMCYFNCKRCASKIASYSDIFAMAKGSVNANYCNPAGYIHETLTVLKSFDNALKLYDRPSTQFSWFPGYAWHIAICNVCETHIGWKFTAREKHLKPKTFFGLSCKSLVVSPESRTLYEADESIESSDD